MATGWANGNFVLPLDWFPAFLKLPRQAPRNPP